MTGTGGGFGGSHGSVGQVSRASRRWGRGDTEGPAASVAQATGRVRVAVPSDDGELSDRYLPLARYVLNRSRLSHWGAVDHPLPPLHHPPLIWGWSAHATRSHRRGSRCPTCAEGSGVTWLLTRGL
ncbi:hypothetical protein F0L17_15155 [Streptomyces sp. TRM43335]|uniref:Uncharacterized protein n=1 Tax=Streptomyces taklimakanensis TaxID=2569853 RepID=A0A6G2BEB3_9ACTN|nr:hypothetical protein [Streptomyces taklimakanensis]